MFDAMLEKRLTEARLARREFARWQREGRPPAWFAGPGVVLRAIVAFVIGRMRRAS